MTDESLPKAKRKKLSDEDDKEYSYDYINLSLNYPPLKPYLIYKGSKDAVIDWKDPVAVRILNESILHVLYNIKIKIAHNHLCPNVTSRVMYIDWIKYLIGPYIESHPGESVHGIDIGTGASCIYPLLGKRLGNWNFLATEIDDESIEYAKQNVRLNKWEDCIKIVKPLNKDRIILDILSEHDDKKIYNFCMCNPPFFSSVEEKKQRSDTNCIATSSELATDGGEFQFIKTIIDESILLKDKIRWFTTLVGRKKNRKGLIDYLKGHSLKPLIETSEFKPGKTSRWTIAWTFDKETIDLFRLQKKKEISDKTIYTETNYHIIINNTIETILHKLNSFFELHSIPYNYDNENFIGTGKVYITNKWYINQNINQKEADSEVNKTIGPEFPPQILFSFQIQILKMMQKNSFCVKMIINKESYKEQNQSLQGFGRLFNDLKSFLIK